MHPHSWVRLLSSRLVGLLFAAHTPEEVVQSILRSNGDGGDDESLLVQRTRRRKRKRMADNGGYREQYLYQDTLHKVGGKITLMNSMRLVWVRFCLFVCLFVVIFGFWLFCVVGM